MTEQQRLPHFVRKQVELATGQLAKSFEQTRIQVEIIGCRVLVKRIQPHPVKAETIRMPLALLDYKVDGWHLFYRGTQGGWQPLEAEPPTQSIEPLLEAILTDEQRVFWR